MSGNRPLTSNVNNNNSKHVVTRYATLVTKMSLTKETFEEAKKKAQERISQWVEATKNSGISRLQDRYNNTFKRMEWMNKRPSLMNAGKTMTKILPNKTRQSDEVKGKERKPDKLSEDKTTEGSYPCIEAERMTPDRAHSRLTHSRLSRCKSQARSRQTPERCQSSRHSSGRPSESRRKYRDSASLIFGENRNNRSSMMASACSDALSLIFDGLNTESGATGFDKGTPKLTVNMNKREVKITKNNKKEVNMIKLSHNKRNQNVEFTPVATDISYVRGISKRSVNKTTKEKRLSVFPANFKRKRRTQTRDYQVDAPVFGFKDADEQSLPPMQESSGESSSINLRTVSTPVMMTTNRLPTINKGPLTMATASNRNISSPITMHLKTVAMVRRIKSGRFRSPPSHSQKRNSIDSGRDIKLSSPEQDLRRKNALKRFKGLIRKIVCVLALIKSAVKNVKQLMDSERKRLRKKSKVLMAFDPSYYSSATTSCGNLSLKSRMALCKLPHLRTESDIRILTEVMCRLAFLAKYSRQVKEELARIVWYDVYEKGRIIIRQGDVGQRMYFTISGSVSVHRTEVDPNTDTTTVQFLRDIEPGSTFGELALVRNITRTYTAVCKEESEFLSVGKDEFNLVLRNTWEESWQQRYNFINNSPYFTEWTSEQIRNTSDVSLIKEYGRNTVVFGDQVELTDWVYFILKGKCDLVRKVPLIRAKSPYKRSVLYLPGNKQERFTSFLNKNYGKKLRRLKKESHYLTVMTLNEGDFFGVGEDLREHYVITNSKTECMLLNSASYSIHSKRDELVRLKEKRESELPSKVDLYRKFEINRKWREYKKSVVDQVVKHRSFPNNTTYNDVPISNRLDPGIPWNLISHH